MIECVIGKIGAGKTTLAARYAYKAQKRGMKVYTNVPELDGILITPDDFGKYNISDGLLIWDEAAISIDARRFKDTTRTPMLNALRTSRHDNLNAVFFSQATDFDVVIRRLSSSCWVVRRGLVFSSLSRFTPTITVDEVSGDIVSKWVKCPQIPFLNHKWVYRPRWYKYFNSWQSYTRSLPTLPHELEWLSSHNMGGVKGELE